AVDWIDDDERATGEAVRVVGCLLGQPAGLGKGLAEARFQESVDGEVGLGDRGAASLRVDAGRCRTAMAKVRERKPSGLARGFGQTIARAERALVRVDAQRSFVRGPKEKSEPGFSPARLDPQSRRRRRRRRLEAIRASVRREARRSALRWIEGLMQGARPAGFWARLRGLRGRPRKLEPRGPFQRLTRQDCHLLRRCAVKMAPRAAWKDFEEKRKDFQARRKEIQIFRKVLQTWLFRKTNHSNGLRRAEIATSEGFPGACVMVQVRQGHNDATSQEIRPVPSLRQFRP